MRINSSTLLTRTTIDLYLELQRTSNLLLVKAI